MEFIKWCMRKAYVTWIDWQVELHGRYSFERLHNLQAYARKTPLPRAITITLLTPIPCLVLITLIDCVPLANPEAGSSANYVHWIRNFITVVLMTYAVLEQFRYTVPGLPLNPMRFNIVAVFASLGGVSFQLLMSHAIGFPLPFSIVMGTPVWAIVIIVFFQYYFARLIRENAQARIDLTNYMFVFLCQITLTFVYPAYVYGFQSIHPDNQKFYVVLLPLIKLLFRNWISKFVGELDDLKPELVIFNVEIFNALFVSCCMQRSSLVSTTLVVTLVDWATALVSLRDILLAHSEVKEVLNLIPADHAWHGLSFVAVAEKLIQEDSFIRFHPSLRAKCKHSTQLMLTVAPKKKYDAVVKSDSSHSSTVLPVSEAGLFDPHTQRQEITSVEEKKHPELPPSTVLLTKLIMPTEKTSQAPQKANTELKTKEGNFLNETERLRFVQNVLQLLFTTEFVLLLEYTIVAAPVIYSVYISAVYQLNNRIYYAQLASLNEHELRRRISNVMLYACLQLLALVAMAFTLKKKLRISVFKQTAFVLENQWTLVHSKVILWFFYCVQNSLFHFGADYSFTFMWLSQPETLPTPPPPSI